MTMHRTWNEARSAAQASANRSGYSMGIEKTREYGRTMYRVFLMPQNPAGHEFRAECVEPMHTTKTGR